ncbi:cytochrome b/b6 domain-containing protein [Pseudoduganella sp. LjRoot289]|uniref:cytochrome b/b6 domain-containing protein n=1 Tax=Pseudoduganella sp. LjRoot289 TaxID=3342314 RepID=UPI003ECF7B9A
MSTSISAKTGAGTGASTGSRTGARTGGDVRIDTRTDTRANPRASASSGAGASAAVQELRSGLPLKRIRVWDLPTRLFHWSLVLAVSVAVGTGLIGGDLMPVHGYAGLAIVGLVAFRLVWGVAGSAHARFLNFAPTPARLRAYFSGSWQGHGHNPVGALSVFALLVLLAAQAVTGLLGNDEISFAGPLARLVEESTSLRLTGLHQQLAYVLLGFMALHVAAVLAYLAVRKTNLVKPMVTGWKEVPGTAGGHGVRAGWPALAAGLAIAGLATYYASGAGF